MLDNKVFKFDIHVNLCYNVYMEQKVEQCLYYNRGCRRTPYAKGMCSSCYRKKRNGIEPMTGHMRTNPINGGPCYYQEKGCNRTAIVKGLCKPCYEKMRRGVEPMTGPMKGNRGSRQVNPKGYVYLYYPEHPDAMRTGYVAEHRKVMSDFLERPLLNEETVHHKDGDRANNALENLELWSTAQPAGQRVKDKVDYAIEILTLYAPQLLREAGHNV